jgi:hypothetical protein
LISSVPSARAISQLVQVAGQALGGFGRVEGVDVVKGVGLAGQGLVDGGAEGVVVEAWREILRGHGWGTSRGL